MPAAKKTAAKIAPIKSKFNEETNSNHIVLPGDQQALMDEMQETGSIPEGYDFTPHNAGHPFSKSGTEVEENLDDHITPPTA